MIQRIESLLKKCSTMSFLKSSVLSKTHLIKKNTDLEMTGETTGSHSQTDIHKVHTTTPHQEEAAKTITIKIIKMGYPYLYLTVKEMEKIKTAINTCNIQTHIKIPVNNINILSKMAIIHLNHLRNTEHQEVTKNMSKYKKVLAI